MGDPAAQEKAWRLAEIVDDQGQLPEFVDYVIELLGPFGTVSARRMFSGHGIFLDGLMFALVAREALWFKADDMNRAEFERADCEVFQYERSGRMASISFYRAPADAMESPADALPWARSAYAAALRANAKKVAAKRAADSAKATPKPSTAVKRGGARPSKRPAPHPAPRATRGTKTSTSRRTSRKTARHR